jgi:3-oxoacyl-[acyl-carrier-protein] synthase II
MAVMAAKMAVEDSKAEIDKMDRSRVGVLMGTTMGEIQALERMGKIRVMRGEHNLALKLLQKYAAVNFPASVAKAFGIKGQTTIINNACAAGNCAITYSYELIKAEKLDLVLAGAADPFSMLAFTGFNRLGAVSPDAVRPFDKDANGMMVSEGAGMIVMEPLSGALRRKARIYAEIVGYGITCDANHITAPHPDGVVRAMKLALERAEVIPSAIDCVIAHGTGTQLNDKAEIAALAEVFGDQTGEIPVTSIKSMIGHTMGSASAIEAITNALIVSNDIIPPTINFEKSHPEMNSKIRIVGNRRLKRRINYGMNNALAFGGINSSIIMKKFARG